MKCVNCGKDLIPGALFCASCGAKVSNEIPTPIVTEGGKGKKIRTRLIGIIAVAVVIAAVGFGGFKGWKWFHPDVEKQLVYCKNGALYYIGNMDEEKDPVKVYDANDDDGYFHAKLSKDQKYLFFQDCKDEESRLYRVKTQKLTSDESKNEKYIEEVDDDVVNFKTIGSGKVLYYRRSKREYNDLYYYDGKKSRTVDSNVEKQYRAGDTVYYIKYNNQDPYGNDTLCYYNLSSQKQGEIGAGVISDSYGSCSYNENSILYGKCVDLGDGDDTSVYDLYMAKPGSKAIKIGSDVYGWKGDVNVGNVYYTKLRQRKKHTYYDYVEDSYVNQDQNASEPDLDDYLETVDVDDILDDYDYKNYNTWTNQYDFFNNNGSYDEDLGQYAFHRMGYAYLPSNYFYEWYQVDDSYYDDLQKYNDACRRDELRNELKDTEYGSASYDLYLYNSKSGEKKIAESVSYDPLYGKLDPKNEICTYRKINEKKVTPVCSIDDISSVSDLEEKLNDSDQKDKTIYVSVGTQEQKMKTWSTTGYFDCSEDGKTVIVSEHSGDESNIVAYAKKGNRLEKVGIVEKKDDWGFYDHFFVGNDFYYLYDDKDGDYHFYVYANGKRKKIVDYERYVKIQKDGCCTALEHHDETWDLKIIDPKGEEGTIRDIDDPYNYGGYCYIDKKHILYWKSNDLYVYDGKDSRKIDRDVDDFWCMNRLHGGSY